LIISLGDIEENKSVGFYFLLKHSVFKTAAKDRMISTLLLIF